MASLRWPCRGIHGALSNSTTAFHTASTAGSSNTVLHDHGLAFRSESPELAPRPPPAHVLPALALLISAPLRLCVVCTQLMMFGIHWNCLHVAQASTWLSQWPHAALVSSIVTASCVVGDQALQRCFPARQGALFCFLWHGASASTVTPMCTDVVEHPCACVFV